MRRSLTKRKCKHCQTVFAPDPRSARRQRYCSKPACRRASKTASQHRWLQPPHNRAYFRGPPHVERVRQWRKDNPATGDAGALGHPMRYKMTWRRKRHKNNNLTMV